MTNQNHARLAARALPDRLSDSDLKAFQSTALELSGIKLDDSKRSMIYTRFLRRLRTLGMSDFKEYLEYAAQPESGERQDFINTITTNLTYFFREAHHFEYLSETALPTLLKSRTTTEPLRVWSAGCSSGEEPYSIAMTLQAAGLVGERDYRLLCTDIDTDMVRKTRAGAFRTDGIRGLNKSQLRRWLKDTDGVASVHPSLRKGMICRALNLFDHWPLRAGVDVIFCRNVLIYFKRPDQERVIRGFAEMQTPGCYLFLGHSESIRGLENVYTRVGNTVFKRKST
ncbi:MAG: CheR family methyltransferase [Pseudomonadota bacterium]